MESSKPTTPSTSRRSVDSDVHTFWNSHCSRSLEATNYLLSISSAICSFRIGRYRFRFFNKSPQSSFLEVRANFNVPVQLHDSFKGSITEVSEVDETLAKHEISVRQICQCFQKNLSDDLEEVTDCSPYHTSLRANLTRYM